GGGVAAGEAVLADGTVGFRDGLRDAEFAVLLRRTGKVQFLPAGAFAVVGELAAALHVGVPRPFVAALPAALVIGLGGFIGAGFVKGGQPGATGKAGEQEEDRQGLGFHGRDYATASPRSHLFEIDNAQALIGPEIPRRCATILSSDLSPRGEGSLGKGDRSGLSEKKRAQGRAFSWAWRIPTPSSASARRRGRRRTRGTARA